MGKKLSEMSLEELWQLFPIFLTEHQKYWKEYEHSRDGYTSAKTEFVKKYTEQAKLIYGNRY